MITGSDGKNYDGVISSISLPNGKIYAIKAIVMEAFPLTCTKCGGKVTIKNGWGTCQYCGTEFTTSIVLKEV